VEARNGFTDPVRNRLSIEKTKYEFPEPCPDLSFIGTIPKEQILKGL
jgi:hypothetical protein